jgi:anti-sigma regulatory factor (Ser/Thr protein kinase)
LQPHQRSVERGRQRLGCLGLADPRLAFEQDRLTHPDGQEQGSGQLVARQVADRLQGGGKRTDHREPLFEIIYRRAAHMA